MDSRRWESYPYLQPAVNRQPGYRREDREVVGRDNIIFLSKKIFFHYFILYPSEQHIIMLRQYKHQQQNQQQRRQKQHQRQQQYRNKTT